VYSSVPFCIGLRLFLKTMITDPEFLPSDVVDRPSIMKRLPIVVLSLASSALGIPPVGSGAPPAMTSLLRYGERFIAI